MYQKQDIMLQWQIHYKAINKIQIYSKNFAEMILKCRRFKCGHIIYVFQYSNFTLAMN